MNRNAADRLVKRCGYLSPAERLVFLALLGVADNADCAVPEWMTPTVTALIEWTSLGRRTVLYAIAHLERHGWIERKSSRGRGHKNEYALVARAPDDDCNCPKRVHLAHLSSSVDTAEKVRQVHRKGAPQDTEKVRRGVEFSQVRTAFARREAGKKGVVGVHGGNQDKPCDHCCQANETKVDNGGNRLCRVCAPHIWKDTA